MSKVTQEQFNRTVEVLRDRGLKEMVAAYILARKNGFVSEAKDIKKIIDRRIEMDGLHAGTVFFCYDDPDNSQIKDAVYDRAVKGNLCLEIIEERAGVVYEP